LQLTDGPVQLADLLSQLEALGRQILLVQPALGFHLGDVVLYPGSEAPCLIGSMAVIPRTRRAGGGCEAGAGRSAALLFAGGGWQKQCLAARGSPREWAVCPRGAECLGQRRQDWQASWRAAASSLAGTGCWVPWRTRRGADPTGAAQDGMLAEPVSSPLPEPAGGEG
jgi:hypothetical protein